jgi:hypothetical protein
MVDTAPAFSAAPAVSTADVLAIDAEVTRATGAAGFGVTRHGFVPKPFPRLLAEKLATARALFGDDLDLTSGSVVRKLFEVVALEEARTWAVLADTYDAGYAVSARGHALTALGTELGLPRPHLEATGTIALSLVPPLPAGLTELVIPRGARLTTAGNHHVATDERVRLSEAEPARANVPVVAFYPGPEHNLDPARPDHLIDRWFRGDPMLADLLAAEAAAGRPLVTIGHTAPLAGGERRWPDERYRDLLLRAPRSVWTVEAVEVAVSLVPGVRRVLVRDAWGGLDLNQSIFGNTTFVERVFGSERDLGSPYYFTVLVAPTPGAVWDGPDGLRAAVESAVEDLRPVGIFPQVVRAEEVGVGVGGDLVVRGLPLPTGSRAAVNASPEAAALKARLLGRVNRAVEALGFGEPVRAAQVVWAMMSEPGVVDVRNPVLLRYPPGFDDVDLTAPQDAPPPAVRACGGNLELAVNQIPVFVADDARLRVV